MTRDIIDINNFVVLIEYSASTRKIVDMCGFDEDAVGIAFYGSGRVDLQMKVGDEVLDFENTKGLALSFYGAEKSFCEHTVYPDQPLQCICIVSSLKNLQKLPAQEQEIYQELLGDLIKPQGNLVRGPRFFMNHDMQSAVEKVFATTYKGAMRTMFLRSQVTELLSHFFSMLAQGVPEKETVSLEERQKLFEAKEILAQNIAEPPSLNELSKLIGLNSYKLKKNFKELFGMPVFKHLQDQRLIKAYDLLKETDTTIQEAAWQVGYESLSSFSNAFSKKYGFRPSEIGR